MLSTPEKTTLALAGLLLAATLVPGCTRSRAARPFSDVTEPQRDEPTLVLVEPGEAAEIGAIAQAEPVPPDVAPPPVGEQPVIVPPTEPIRAETPTAAGPATTEIVGSPERYQLLVPPPAIIEFETVVGGPERAEIPMEIDEVSLVREWPLWIVERPSGNVVAGPTYWPTDYREPRRAELTQAFVEPVEFLWNTLLIPYRMVRTPPGTRVLYDPATDQDTPRAPYELTPVPAELPPPEALE